MYRDEIDTPALVVDVGVLRRNIEDMASFARGLGKRLRPHVKTHKVPEIAKMQLSAGAGGICVQKLGEAEVMAAEGIDDIFISNEVVGAQKMARLVRLAEKIELSVAVDDPQNVQELGRVCREAGVELGVYVDVDSGMHRTGVEPDKAGLLAEAVVGTEGLKLVGVMSYEGHAGGPLEPEERRRLIDESIRLTIEAVKDIRRRGIEPGIVSMGSSATVRRSATCEEVTELQPGMYVFNDWYLVEREAAKPETCALKVLTTVMSKTSNERCAIDAGSKAFHLDMGRYPVCVGVEGVEIYKFSEEHGWVRLKGDAGSRVKLGERLSFIPYHVCPCVNQFDIIYGVEGDRVAYVWQVKARGKMT
ncbi:D-threonine aldolase [archaeon HR01]|nr:D-threonine aldolase [archaeon HR01]